MEHLPLKNRIRSSVRNDASLVDLLKKRPCPPNAYPCEISTPVALSKQPDCNTTSNSVLSQADKIPKADEMNQLEDANVVPYRILIQLRFKRAEEWNELYDRFMIFSRQWHLDSIMGVLEFIIDSSLSQPFIVKVPAPNLQENDKPFVQTLDLQFETEARHKEFQNKWTKFQKVYSAYDNAMAFTLGMDLLFGVIPVHFLEFVDDRIRTATVYQEIKGFDKNTEEMKPLDMSNAGIQKSNTSSTEKSEVIDLSNSKQVTLQDDRINNQAANTVQTTPTDLTHLPDQNHVVERIPESSATGSPTLSFSSPRPVKDIEKQKSRRKSAPQKKRCAPNDKTANTNFDEHYSKPLSSGPGSDSGFLTDPECINSPNGDEVLRSRPQNELDSTVNFIVQDLHAVRYLAQTVELHRLGHNCFNPLEIHDIELKDGLVEFYLQCSLKHAYQIDLFYESVDGNCHVYG